MMNKRNLAAEIIAGLNEFQAWRNGKRSLRVHKVELPKAADVQGIRHKLKLSQDAFAAFMSVSVGTLRNWEQRRREPQGPARAFLHVASTDPRAVLSAFTKPARRVTKRAMASRPAAADHRRSKAMRLS